MLRGEVAQLGGKTLPLTVLFSDIRGFTSISENADPAIIANHLSEYFSVVLGVLESHSATIDKMIGDAVMAFWGAPIPDDNQINNALDAVLACAKRLDEMNAKWLSEGKPALPTTFGIAHGSAIVGNIGSPKRMNYTAIGDTVNLASRLEGMNRTYGTQILVGEEARLQSRPEFVWREVVKVAARGRTQETRVFELLGVEGEVDPERLRFARSYERILRLLRMGQPLLARAELQQALAEWPQDESLLYLERAAAKWDDPSPDPNTSTILK